MIPSISDLISVINKTQEVFNNKHRRKALDRLLTTEIRHNLNLIEIISNKSINDPKIYIPIIDLFEINILTVYLTESKEKLTTLFKDNQKVEKENEIDDLIVNIILKIKMLKSISKLTNTIELKGIKFNIRIKNLEKKLIQLIKNIEK